MNRFSRILFSRYKYSSQFIPLIIGKNDYSKSSTAFPYTTPLSLSLLFAIGTVGTYEFYKKYRLHALTQDTFDGIQSKESSIKARMRKTKDQLPYSKQYNFIADVVEHVAPAVVHIEVDLDPVGYYGHFSGSIGTTNGSGFLINETGLLLTNAHVVRNKKNVRVKLADGRRFTGNVLAADMLADLAVVQIDATDLKLPFLDLGDSEKIRAGEHCIAVGSPLSLSNTVTAGIVSNIGRTSNELGLYGRNINYIQTDCMITSGNSGGPLVNLDGEVIGINTMKVMTGISFSLPINYAKLFLADVEKKRSSSISKSKSRANNRRSKRYLGVKMFSLTPEIVDELRHRMSILISITRGVYIATVMPNTEAQRAGLQPGDIVIQVNGQDVATSADLINHVQEDDVLNLRVIRNNSLVFDIRVTPELIE